MDPDEDGEVGRSEDNPAPATMEEMRKKRLAYFNVANTKKSVSEWELENPLSTKATGKVSSHSPREYFNDQKTVNSTSQHERANHILIEKNSPSLHRSMNDSGLANVSCATAGFTAHIENPTFSKQEPQHSTGRLDFMDKDPKPLRPKKERSTQKSVDSDTSHFQLTESQDIEALSIFNSHPDLGDLGLSTHRPESENSSRTIQGELFIPATHGPGKTTKQIFSEKVEEEIRSALGDEKMEKLMLKVNADIGQLHQQNRSPRRRQRLDDPKIVRHDQNGNSLSRSSSVDSFSPFTSAERPLGSYRSRAGSQSPRRHPVPHSFQEGERDVPTLVRNYDQITVPRNTKNSFSSEEIYRKAYGGLQESPPSPEKYSMRRWSNADYATQGENRVYPVSNRGRKASTENLASAPTPPPHFQNYPNMFSLPITSMPPPHFDAQGHSNMPPSPQNSFRGGQTGTAPVFMPNSYPHPHPYLPEPSGNSSLHYSPFTSQSPSCSPSQMPSSNPFFYPNPPFPPHFGGGRFPENIPFHLPPPPILPHQPLKQGQPQGPFEQAVRRNSLSLHGHPGYGDEIAENVPISASLKMPHPPPNPPAISRFEDGVTKGRHVKEVRQIPAHPEQVSGKGNEKDFNSFNLQRYFSSIDLSPANADHSVVRSAPQSSRSVDGDFDRPNNDDGASSVTGASEFTSVTKAGGITNRLGDLGVNLDNLKHLWVVDSKGDADSKNDDLSKQIRRCPECGTANKVYMMWCIECSESLIGVEPSMPRGKKSKQRTPMAESGSLSQEGGRRRTIDQEEKPQSHTGDSDLEDGGYQRKDSPESGKGISLSSSPVRYRRDQEELAEPKDSGRASIGDPKEGGSHNNLENKESMGAFEEVGENEEVEYIYEDVEADIYEQISDPILRDFIISYRNRQELNLDPILNSYVISDNNKPGGSDHPSKFSKGNGKDSRDNRVFSEEQKFSTEDDVYRSGKSEQIRHHDINNLNYMSERNLKNSSTSHETNGVGTGDSYPGSTLEKSQFHENASKPKKTKKKKKHRSDPIDIEIFGYEETRQSRNSSRCENIVPVLNLVRSSEEEESSSEDDDSEEQNRNIIYGAEELADSVTTAANDPPQPQKSGVPRYQANRSKQNPSVREVAKRPAKPVSQSQASSSFSSPFKQSGVASQGPGSQAKPKGSNPVPANYQRHWARSSIAWSSYKPRELSTRSSVIGPPQQDGANGSRPSSARLPQHRANPSDESSVRSSTGMQNRQRPASAEYSRRKPASNVGQQFRPSSASHSPGQRPAANVTRPYPSSSVSFSSNASASTLSHAAPESSKDPRRNGARTTSLSQPSPPPQGNGDVSEVSNSQDSAKENDSPRLLCSELHRLPFEEEDGPSDKMHAIAKTAYDRFHELTPRIQDGGLSLWQCLPDEIWLYILSFLSQADLARLMMVSGGFHRLANDVTLWRYITVRPRYSVTDEALGSIASHRPISLAMVKCQGPHLSREALHSFFRDTQEHLKELNICGCSQGSLVGSVVLDAASNYCHNLTHVDVSFCNVRDNSFLAMVNAVNRLESLCVNGFQSMSDSALLTLLKKHGKSLHTLELYACFSLTASVLRKLGDYCVKLRRLCLGGCNKLTDSTMITLSTCLPKIEELDLRGCKNLRNDCIRKIVKNCPRISMLVLANCQQISDAALVEMGTYLKDTLRVVDVCGCNLVGDQGVISLAKNCNQLVSLDISSSKCTSNSVNHLASSGCSRWLKTVKLSFLTGLSEVSMLNLLRQCPRLRLIHIFGCPSLKNLTKLKSANPKVCIEGDVEMPRLSFQ